MKRISFDKKSFKKFLETAKVINNNGRYVFDVNGELIKINPVFLEDFYNSKKALHPSYGVNVDQIEWLSNLDYKVSSSLPNGIVSFDHKNIGVIYPNIFYGYADFNKLPREEKLTFLNNLKTAINKHIELMQNGIYNKDFINKNILYKGEDVQLIDLDGKYISNEYCNTYEYFIDNLRTILMQKIRKGYSVKEFLEIMKEVDSIIKEGYNSSIDCPLQIVKKVEKMNVIK